MGRFRKSLGLGPTGRFFGPGELRLALLALLTDRPGHGYDLMSRLEERLGGVYSASAGAVYPTLQQLEDEGLVRVESADGRKVHHLTPAGRDEIAARTQDIEAIWARAATRSEWGLFGEPDAAEIIGPVLRLVKAAIKTIAHAHGDPDAVDRARGIIDDARRRLEALK